MAGTNTKSAVNVRIDTNVKEKAVKLLGQMGIGQTMAIEMFYRKIIEGNCMPFQSEPLPSVDGQLTELIKSRIKNKASIKLDTDGKGNIIIDPEKQPQVYDWAVNG